MKCNSTDHVSPGHCRNTHHHASPPIPGLTVSSGSLFCGNWFSSASEGLQRSACPKAEHAKEILTLSSNEVGTDIPWANAYRTSFKPCIGDLIGSCVRCT